jgi:hypothetical protein
VDTDITDPEITELIEESSAWMDIKLDTAALNALILRMIARTHVGIRCMLKDPNSQAIGEYREARARAMRTRGGGSSSGRRAGSTPPGPAP